MLIAYFLHFAVIFKAEVHLVRETSSQTKHTVILGGDRISQERSREIPRDKITH